jgi:hypothetical protein
MSSTPATGRNKTEYGKMGAMKNLFRSKTVLVLFVLFYSMTPQDAHAYLDPGTGSYVLQMVIAAILGAGFAMKIYWRKISAFISSRFSKKPPSGEGDD